MGAVTAIKVNKLLVEEHQPVKILGLVLDSPFISLKQIVVNMGQAKMNVPEFVIKALFLIIGSSIEERAAFKV